MTILAGNNAKTKMEVTLRLVVKSVIDLFSIIPTIEILFQGIFGTTDWIILFCFILNWKIFSPRTM